MLNHIKFGEGMVKRGAWVVVFGIVINFALFLLKLYIGIASNALSVYCDAVNNLGDVLTCLTALAGFWFIARLDKQRGMRAESLCSFVIGLAIACMGGYFVYNGIDRFLYPLPIAYTYKHALLLFLTIPVKIGMGFAFLAARKRQSSAVLKALMLDCFLDSAMTAFVLMGFFLVAKVQFAVDGIFAIAVGAMILGSALKTIFGEAKFLVNSETDGGTDNESSSK